MRSCRKVALAATLTLSLLASGVARAQNDGGGPDGLPGLPDFYVGVDGRQTITYRGPNDAAGVSLANPNFGRLTLLFAHTYADVPANNHYHGIGAYSYSGPAANPTVVDTSSGNRIPEVYQRNAGYPPLFLIKADPSRPGQYVSGYDRNNEYHDLLTASPQLLTGANLPAGAGVLFNSSAQRWTTALGAAQLEVEVVDITPGLNILNALGGDAFYTSGVDSVGRRFGIGTGDNFQFKPLFAVDGAAPVGSNYSVTFRLHDARTSGGFGSSGRFGFDLQTSNAPEPGVGVLTVAGALGFAVVRRRRK
jgi:hypothetical protein